MNIGNLWAEIENEQTWRTDEIRFFQNQLTNIPDEEGQDQFRRALILILYAHFEGFCKFALTLYVNTVNSEGIKCGEANFSIAAASLSGLFKNLRNPDMKTDFFRGPLPDDTQLHSFARDKEFVEMSNNFLETPVQIPDGFIDVESNLKPVVLKKNLFKLGLPHDLFNEIEGMIHELLNFRNKIAHGELKAGIQEHKYAQLRDTVFKIMTEVKREVMKALKEEKFLRT